jgi:hypothetical protein
MQWREQTVEIGGRTFPCRFRVVKDMIEVTSGDLRTVEVLGVLRPEVVARDALRRALKRRGKV